MPFKGVVNQLNVFHQCRRYGLSLWQCPSFLFLIMGLVIIVSSLLAWAIGSRYIDNPSQVALFVLGLTTVLLIMAFVITKSFEKLAEANRLKSEFINVVSHQLRTPLSNLNWSIELLMSGRLGRIEEKQTEYLRILKENISRMGELVADLLTVSRIETAGLPQKKQEVFLPDLIEELILELSPFARALNVEIKFEKEHDLPKVLVDPLQLRQVLENLLDNAIRYTKNKGLVKVAVFRKKNNIRVEVEDNGVGIPSEDQKYIFQKFFRSENALKYQTHGSGLGLYIAKSIIERSGGKIGFKSQEGKGTTFWFMLPIKS